MRQRRGDGRRQRSCFIYCVFLSHACFQKELQFLLQLVVACRAYLLFSSLSLASSLWFISENVLKQPQVKTHLWCPRESGFICLGVIPVLPFLSSLVSLLKDATSYRKPVLTVTVCASPHTL